jgi:hypothetical protein
MSTEQPDCDDFVIRELAPKEVAAHAGDVRDVGVTVLPLRRMDDGRGVYAEEQVFMVKELRAEGVDIGFADEADNRVFEAKCGFMTEWAVPYLFGVATNGGWAGLEALVRRIRGVEKDVRITAIEAGPDGKGWMIEGSVDKLPRAVEKVQREARRADGK